ncbi:SPARC-like protein 1 [Brachyhypopomus gauderio]|uniref:SPARC-like protein 1 n=1 Tax=Brachyhypopomus gauderio TaxID=698409 RepID=UPI0040413481
MKLSPHLLVLLLMMLHLNITLGGRAQRRQRQAENLLKPYLGRTNPATLCAVLKCYSPTGSWCQVIKNGKVSVPKCVCPTTCPWQETPVCSVLGKTYSNECLLHKDACRKKRHITKAHDGPCFGSAEECSDQELAQFPYRLLDWFLLLSRMGKPYTAAPTQSCLSHSHRMQLAQRKFAQLDRNRDGNLSRRDLKKLHHKRIPQEHCATAFFQSCDRNRNKKVTLREWTSCLVNRSEKWFQNFMSVRMGSSKICR